jgi:hypothetical protein
MGDFGVHRYILQPSNTEGHDMELARRSIAYIHRLCSIRIGTIAYPGADSPCNECQTFIRSSSFLRSLSVVLKVISKPGGDVA